MNKDNVIVFTSKKTNNEFDYTLYHYNSLP